MIRLLCDRLFVYLIKFVLTRFCALPRDRWLILISLHSRNCGTVDDWPHSVLCHTTVAITWR